MVKRNLKRPCEQHLVIFFYLWEVSNKNQSSYSPLPIFHTFQLWLPPFDLKGRNVRFHYLIIMLQIYLNYICTGLRANLDHLEQDDHLFMLQPVHTLSDFHVQLQSASSLGTFGQIVSLFNVTANINYHYCINYAINPILKHSSSIAFVYKGVYLFSHLRKTS